MLQEDVIPFLLDRGFICQEHLVNGALVVVDASRRNRNFKVVSECGPSYLIKQGIGPDRRQTVAREAVVYEYLRSISCGGQLARFLPGLCGYVPEDCVLILELMKESESLAEYHRHGRFSQTLARELGKALADVHRLTSQVSGQPIDPRLPSHLPAALSLFRPDLDGMQQASNADLELIKVVQQSKDFCEHLEELCDGWRVDTLIHGDMRWDNCHAVAKSPSARKTRIAVVDWELAGPGDACWDVGTVFNEYLNFWLLSAPIAGDTLPEQFLEFALYPLKKMQSAIRAFWQSYVKRMQLDPHAADRWLERAVKYAGSRLIQTTFERMHLVFELTSQAVYYLQLSLNMLRRPEDASRQLLGLSFAST